MKRREFLRKSVGAGFVAGTTLSFTGYNKLFGSELAERNSPYDLVAVRGGEPEVMFDTVFRPEHVRFLFLTIHAITGGDLTRTAELRLP